MIKFKTVIKAIAISAVAGSVLFLAGCSSHPNTLLTGKPKLAAQYVYKAWYFGATKSHTNYSYAKCTTYVSSLENPITGESGKKVCAPLFKAMAEYKTKDKTLMQFNGTTAEQFQDPKVVKKVGNLVENLYSTDGQQEYIPGLPNQ
jgi:hypothetical protein